MASPDRRDRVAALTATSSARRGSVLSIGGRSMAGSATSTCVVNDLGATVTLHEHEGMTELHYAVRTGDLDLVKQVIADEGRAVLEEVDDEGWTAMHEAANAGMAHLCEYLHSLGLGLEARTMGKKETPLHVAASAGQSAAVEMLCLLGAATEARDDAHMTPLLDAAALGSRPSCATLVEHGADVHATNSDGEGCLHLTGNAARVECTKFLLEAGCVPMARCSQQTTALHQAALGGSGECVQTLIDAGCIVDAVDVDGGTPLQFAANRNRDDAVRVLLRAGADPNSRDCEGHTPLHHAGGAGSLECSRILLDAGADRRIAGHKDERFPWNFADVGGYADVVDLLYFEETPPSSPEPPPPAEERVPGAPAQCEVYAMTAEHMGVSWQPPADCGTSPLLGYDLEKRADDGEWENVTQLDDGDEESEIVPVETNRTYVFRVRAFNDAGRGPWCEPSEPRDSARAPGPPSAPEPYHVSVSQLAVQWEPPASTGGIDVEAYEVELSTDGGIAWASAGLVTELYGALPIRPGLEYVTRVAALNAAGKSAFGPASVAVRAPFDATSPSTPTVKDVSREAMTVEWHAPGDLEGVTLVAYTLHASRDGGASWNDAAVTDGATTSFVFSGPMAPRERFVFRVRADIADVGPSPWSPASAAAVVPDVPTMPDPPLAALVAARLPALAVDVEWLTADEDTDLVPPVTAFDIQVSADDGGTWSDAAAVTSPQWTFDAGQAYTTYVFRVRSRNSLGASLWSLASDGIECPGPPRTPDAPSARLEDDVADAMGIVVSWPAVDSGVAEDGPNAVDAYEVGVTTDAGDHWRDGGEQAPDHCRYVDDGVAGKTYAYRLRARNSCGWSAWSQPSRPLAIAAPVDVPSAPAAPMVSSVAPHHVRLAWKLSGETNGADVTRVELARLVGDADGPWPADALGSGDASFLETDDASVEPGELYRYRVRCANSAGWSAWSASSEPCRVPHLPEGPPAPTLTVEYEDCEPVVDSGDEGGSTVLAQSRIVVSWQPPASDGHSPLVGYLVQTWARSDGSEWTPPVTVAADVHTVTVPGVLGRAYAARVMAKNGIGVGPSGPASAKVQVMHVPHAPLAIALEQTRIEGALVTLELASAVASRPIDQVLLEVQPVARAAEDELSEDVTVAGSWFVAAHCAPGGPYETTPGKLEPGRLYRMRARASNRVGISAAGPSTAAFALPEGPSQPRPPGVRDIQGARCLVAWARPSRDGGESVDRFELEMACVDEEPLVWTSAFSGPGHELSAHADVEPRSTYRFRVRARNAVAWSPWSEPGPATYIPSVPDAPEAPRIAATTATTIRVEWTAPFDGGAPVKHFEVEMTTNGGRSWERPMSASSGIRAAVHAHLRTAATHALVCATQGERYHFRVRAVNAVGVGPSSPKSARAELARVPRAPASPTVTDVSSAYLTVRWQPPTDDGGSPIVDYMVEQSTDDGAHWRMAGRIDGAPLTVAVQGGSVYRFRVRAENAIGPSPFSAPSAPQLAAEPPSAPGRPYVERVIARRLVVKWAPPANPGGAPVSSYIVQLSTDGGTTWRDGVELGPDAMYKIGVDPDIASYTFRVWAVNDLGKSPPSEPSEPKVVDRPVNHFKPMAVPDRVKIKPATPRPPEQVTMDEIRTYADVVVSTPYLACQFPRQILLKKGAAATHPRAKAKGRSNGGKSKGKGKGKGKSTPRLRPVTDFLMAPSRPGAGAGQGDSKTLHYCTELCCVGPSAPGHHRHGRRPGVGAELQPVAAARYAAAFADEDVLDGGETPAETSPGRVQVARPASRERMLRLVSVRNVPRLSVADAQTDAHGRHVRRIVHQQTYETTRDYLSRHVHLPRLESDVQRRRILDHDDAWGRL